jgi:hypothetical protein
MDIWIVTLAFAVPLLMAAAAFLMDWGYRRALHRSMLRKPAPPASTEVQPEPPVPSSDGPRLCLLQAAAVRREPGPAAAQVFEDALAVTARARFAYVAAALAYAAVSTAFLIHSTVKLPFAARVLTPCMIVMPQLVIVTSFLNLSLRRRLVVFLGYALAGSLLALLVAGPKGTLGLLFSFSVFVVYPLAGLSVLRTRRMRPFLSILLAASLLYFGAAMFPFYLILPDPAGPALDTMKEKPWLIFIGLVNVVLSVILTGKLLKQPKAVRAIGIAVLAAVALAGNGLLFKDVPTVLWVLSGTAGSTLGVLFAWLVFKIFVGLQKRRLLTPEILDAHFCWTYLTLYLLVFVWGLGELGTFSDPRLLRRGLLLALALFPVVLHTLLLRVRAQRPRQAPRRLLVLRVFGRAEEREDLLDALGDTWCRIGAVDLFAHSDVASRTLRSSMLEAFLLRRSDDQFLKTEAEVDAQLDHLRSEIEGDARYPVNSVYSYGTVWQHAFVRLAEQSDAVLMDMRGFTAERKSSAWELAYLVQHTALRRVVLLVDRHPGVVEALEQVAREAWTRLPPESPNARDPEPGITALSFTHGSEAEKSALFELLLSAASEESASPRLA